MGGEISCLEGLSVFVRIFAPTCVVSSGPDRFP